MYKKKERNPMSACAWRIFIEFRILCCRAVDVIDCIYLAIHVVFAQLRFIWLLIPKFDDSFKIFCIPIVKVLFPFYFSKTKRLPFFFYFPYTCIIRSIYVLLPRNIPKAHPFDERLEALWFHSMISN